MSEHLEKAKGALGAARDILDRSAPDHHGLLPVADAEDFAHKLAVAKAQADVAAAEALTRIADAIEAWSAPPVPTWSDGRNGS